MKTTILVLSALTLSILITWSAYGQNYSPKAVTPKYRITIPSTAIEIPVVSYEISNQGNTLMTRDMAGRTYLIQGHYVITSILPY